VGLIVPEIVKVGLTWAVAAKFTPETLAALTVALRLVGVKV
jgi:hypothetical protein